MFFEARALLGFVVEAFQPLHLTFAFAVGGVHAEAFGEVVEDVVVVFGFALRFDEFFHRHDVHVGVVAGHGEVVAFVAGGRGQDDVGVFGGRGPVGFVDDDDFGFLPTGAQAVQVLVVVVGVATAPPDHADVRVVAGLTVVGVFAAGVVQGVGDARDRDGKFARAAFKPVGAAACLGGGVADVGQDA